MSAPATFRHLSLQEFITDKEEEGSVETKVSYTTFSSEESEQSSRHSSTSSQVRDEDGEDPSHIGDEGQEDEDEVEDDNIFEDNQPLLKCPETKDVVRANKSKSDL